MKYCLLFLVGLLSFTSNAEDGFDDDGFDETPIDIVVQVEDAPGTLYGSVDLEAHYNLSNDKNLSSLKTLVDVLGDYKFENGVNLSGNLKGYHDFIYDLENRTVPNGYKNDINLNELNIELEISPNLDFKTGRQVIVWGKSDSIRITDILNPLDNRTPGLVDIKNLRLGRTMSKLDYYKDGYNASAILIHENRFSENPMQFSDFKPTAINKPINTPDDSLDNTTVALSLTGAFSGYDFGLYYADTYLDKPYLTNNNTTLDYNNKSTMIGAAYNQAIDSYLFKAEAAHFDNIQYNGVTDTKARTDIMIGVEYTGITDGSIGYEVAVRKIHDYDSLINVESNGFKPENEYQQVARFSQSYLNQTLDLSAVASVVGLRGEDGGSIRLELDYAIDDQRSVSGGVIDYIGGDNSVIDAYKDNDRLFTKLSYAF
ncbi:MAG: hypothetical protein PSN35_05600 [Candidatus Thioglobus sp.]|uniref:DUF1302 family protein n=1 Tax=Candidatus Thioglobus sp. TaxID=2026721 RepID=UPI00261BC180|nr:DUF1302 family protein [Candidatus Thioglobus sp.]MDC9727290.1 hypothetical protein [Candidatus Thioglobus sp.]